MQEKFFYDQMAGLTNQPGISGSNPETPLVVSKSRYCLSRHDPITPSLTNQMERALHPACFARRPGRSKHRWHWDPTAVAPPNVFLASPSKVVMSVYVVPVHCMRSHGF